MRLIGLVQVDGEPLEAVVGEDRSFWCDTHGYD
jgi:hypothetical protein